MLICYIDESGTPEVPGNTSHYVLAGLAVPVVKWKTYERQVRDVKRRYDLDGREIHTAYLPRPIVEQNHVLGFEDLSYVQRRIAVEKLRNQHLLNLQATPATHKQYQQTRRNYERTTDYIHLSHIERQTLLSDLAELIASWNDVVLFAYCIDKTEFGVSQYDHTVEEEAFIKVISLFERFLFSKSTWKEFLCGIIVHDNNETMANRLGVMMDSLQEVGELWTKVNHIVEAPFFVDSKAVNMVQMSDFCSYILRRYLENNEDVLIKNVLSRADRMDGQLIGVRHFTRQPCNCLICQSNSTS